jgi:putative ABC transport system permease protein
MRRPLFRLPRRSARTLDADVDEELRFHLDLRAAELAAQRGLDPEAARAEALRQFGDVEDARRYIRALDARTETATRRRDLVDDLRQDLRLALRGLRRNPLFTLLAVVTLALGIGANAAVFGVVKSVLLDALPYADADQLVRVHARFRDGSMERFSLSAGTAADVAERQRSFSRVGVFAGATSEAIYGGDDGPRVVNVSWVEPRLIRTLGVSPALGRALADDDVASDTARAAMLGHAAWQRLFGGDARIVGKVVRLNGVPREVVGVLPRGFVGPVGDAEFYLPMSLAPTLRDPVRARRSHWLSMVARLKPGVTPGAARREVAAIGDALTREHPDDNRNIALSITPLRDDLAGDTRAPLLALWASAGLVLLITCANLAGALLSRLLSRRREFAVRVSLGAGRGRLVRQLLTESTVLALAGGAVGLLFAALGLAALRGLAPAALLPPYAELGLDRGAVLVTALVALGTGLGFGLAPALSASRADVQGTLRDETRGTSEGRRSRRLRGALVAGQIALCVSLLAGAGLLARSLWAMTTAPLGFAPDGVLSVGVQLPPGGYPTPEARAELSARLDERLRALPGVTGVANVSQLPSPTMERNGLAIEGVAWPNGEVPFVYFAVVSDDFFRTLRVPLRRGRGFGPADRPGGTTAIVISEGMARKFWPNGGELGARIRLGPNDQAPWAEVVGVVGDVRNDPARPTPEPMAYASSRQDPWGSRTYLVRTGGDPAALAAPFRRALAAVDPTVPVVHARPLPVVLADRLAGRRVPAALMTAFGALALALASVGVYAMFAAMAAAREREFGVRVALGATRGGIAALVLRQGAVWMGLGLVGGALGIAVVAHSLRDLLYGVRPSDPVALGLAVVTLLACAAAALLVPVRRATRVSPITALR